MNPANASDIACTLSLWVTDFPTPTSHDYAASTGTLHFRCPFAADGLVNFPNGESAPRSACGHAANSSPPQSPPISTFSGPRPRPGAAAGTPTPPRRPAATTRPATPSPLWARPVGAAATPPQSASPPPAPPSPGPAAP